MSKNSVKMTLKGYYDNLPSADCPKTNFINKIAARTKVSVTTVRNWIFYGMKPSNQDYIRILSEETGIPENCLWTD